MKAEHRSLRPWLLAALAVPAAVAVWSGWVGLGEMTGFGKVHPLPGIADGFTLNSAITLPIGVESYAAYALGAWLTRAQLRRRTRLFACGSSIGALILGACGQVAYHLLQASGHTRAPWQITTVVACLPVLVLGMGATLAHMIHGDQRAEPPTTATTPAIAIPAPALTLAAQQDADHVQAYLARKGVLLDRSQIDHGVAAADQASTRRPVVSHFRPWTVTRPAPAPQPRPLLQPRTQASDQGNQADQSASGEAADAPSTSEWTAERVWSAKTVDGKSERTIAAEAGLTRHQVRKLFNDAEQVRSTSGDQQPADSAEAQPASAVNGHDINRQ